MSLATRITDLATRIATECKALRTLLNGNTADLTALTTTAKGNLVAALNEVRAVAVAAGGGAINDAATATGTTWSSQKVNDHVAAQVTAILGGASAAYDTLVEIQSALQADDTDITALLTAVGNRVRFDAVQTLTGPQQLQARANIAAASAADLGDPVTDFVATFITGLT